MLVMETNPKTVVKECGLFEDRLEDRSMSSNNQSKIWLNSWKQYKPDCRRQGDGQGHRRDYEEKGRGIDM